MKTLTVQNITLHTEKFATWSKAKFIAIYNNHFKEAGKVYDLIQKINGESTKNVEESSEVRPINTTEKGIKKPKAKKVNIRP